MNKLSGKLTLQELRKKSILHCVNDCAFTSELNAPIPTTLKKALDISVQTGSLVNAFSEYENEITAYQKELNAHVLKFKLDASDTVKYVVYQQKTAWAFNNLLKHRCTSFSHSCHENNLTHASVCISDGQASSSTAGPKSYTIVNHDSRNKGERKANFLGVNLSLIEYPFSLMILKF